MKASFYFKNLLSDPKWFFRVGLWQFLNPFNLFRWYVKFPWQKLTRGFSDDEIWNLELTIANFILPRIKKYRENNIGTPVKLSLDPRALNDADWEELNKKWLEILDKIILALELTIKNGEDIISKEEYEKMTEGYMLLGEWLPELWE